MLLRLYLVTTWKNKLAANLSWKKSTPLITKIGDLHKPFAACPAVYLHSFLNEMIQT